MTDTNTTTDEPTPNTGYRLVYWGLRFVQVALVLLGAILALGSFGLPTAAGTMFVLFVVAVMWLFALVVEILMVRPAKRRV